MYEHPDVSAANEKRSKTVAQFADRILPNPDYPDQKLAEKIAARMQEVWNDIPDRHQLYYEMQQAVLRGGIGHEWIWHKEASGYERPTRFFVVDKSRFVFDRLGNMALLNRESPVWGSYVGTAQSDNLIKSPPPGKFQYHIYRREPSTWTRPQLEGYMYYGKGEDVPLYYLVQFDYFVLRYRMKYIEKFGIPPYIIRHPMNQAVTPQTLDIIRQLREDSVIAIPKGMPSKDSGDGKDQYYSVDPLEVPTSQQDWFSNFQETYTRPRIYSLLLGQDDANMKAETGGYSSDVQRHDTGPSVFFKFDSRNISGTINSQILPPMTLQMFPNLPRGLWPIHRLESAEERDRNQEMDVAQKFSQMAPIAEDEFYERGGFRKPLPGEKTIGGQAQGQDPFSGPPGAQMPPQFGKSGGAGVLKQGGAPSVPRTPIGAKGGMPGAYGASMRKAIPALGR